MPLTVNLYSSSHGDGPPLLLLHGLFGMSDNLSVISRALSEHFTVHSLDLRNHGRSPHLASMTLNEMAEDVRVYLDRHNLSSTSILGHSLGGKVAMQLAVNHPERVSQMVVADIAPVEYPPHHNEVLSGLQQVDLATISSRREAESFLAKEINEEGVRQFLLKSLYKDQHVFRWRFNVDVITSNYDDLRAPIIGKAFDKPTLFIKGEHSNYIRADYADSIKTLFPKAEFKMIQNTGHWLHAEKPVVFNNIVKRFLLKT